MKKIFLAFSCIIGPAIAFAGGRGAVPVPTTTEPTQLLNFGATGLNAAKSAAVLAQQMNSLVVSIEKTQGMVRDLQSINPAALATTFAGKVGMEALGKNKELYEKMAKASSDVSKSITDVENMRYDIGRAMNSLSGNRWQNMSAAQQMNFLAKQAQIDERNSKFYKSQAEIVNEKAKRAQADIKTFNEIQSQLATSGGSVEAAGITAQAISAYGVTLNETRDISAQVMSYDFHKKMMSEADARELKRRELEGFAEMRRKMGLPN